MKWYLKKIVMMYACELWSLMECIFSTDHWNFFIKEQNNTLTN